MAPCFAAAQKPRGLPPLQEAVPTIINGHGSVREYVHAFVKSVYIPASTKLTVAGLIRRRDGDSLARFFAQAGRVSSAMNPSGPTRHR